ncbi:MAG: cysteine peptidase family C39 domain-containing protein [bacterium]|nr:cysteine peptidase family C39 domain-containing protein [bacterium]
MIKLKPFRQTAGLCGPASLKMVLDYYRVSVAESAVAKAAGASKKEGVSKDDLIKAAKHFGFDAFSKEKSNFGDLRSFIKKEVPVIVDWFSEDDGHYSVVVDIDKENIVLMDPELGGERKFSLEKFQRLWFDFPGKFIRGQKDMILRLIIVVTPLKK